MGMDTNNICDGGYNYSPIIKLEHIISKSITKLYVFIGERDTEITKILTKISKSNDIPNEDIPILVSYFGKDYRKYLVNNKKYSEIVFIYDKINFDDTLDIIKKKISNYVNIPSVYINIWCHCEQNISKITKKIIYNKLSYNTSKKITIYDLKTFVKHYHYIDHIDDIISLDDLSSDNEYTI